ncbi:MAG TPA: hypothetical protein PKB07_16660 [Flavilitoribacter sp.]|nr:hypothetical protein [Flavilitoribacter sp.]
MKKLLTLFLLLSGFASFGQVTGEIDYKYLGVSFTIPEGWMGQEAEMGYLMASNSVPGLILLLPHDQQYNLEQLKTQAQAGLNEGNGTYLQLSGPLADLGNGSIGGTFAGTLEQQPAKAYIIGMCNPYGKGLSIIAVTTSDQFNGNYETYAKAVKNSVKFRKPEAREDIGEWKEWMKNVKLTYMESYNSISPGVDGMTGGGYSLSKEIDLCGAGYFIYYGSSNISTGSDNSSAYSNSRDNGSGKWDIQTGPDGNPVLVLNFNTGETASYTLTYADKKLYLNGTRYFRTTDGEYAPNCK